MLRVFHYKVNINTHLFVDKALAKKTEAALRVRGYYKPSMGSYVTSHYQTNLNSSRFDNYSAKGNYNLYTGKSGTINPFRSYYRW